MARTVELDASATGTAAADGSCVVSLGPTAQQIWMTNNVAVSSTSTDPTEARVYLGPVSPGGYVAGTYDGNNDSAPLRLRINRGGLITVVWSGATPGASCTVSVNGTMIVPG